jgi:hypothetical protein
MESLTDKMKIETHPKVIRWLAYTLAEIYNAKYSYLKENIIRLLEDKRKIVSSQDVVEWLIASIESINRSNGLILHPIELESKQDFDIGVIKSWSYRNFDDKSIHSLIRALNHQDEKIRKWAALSLGNKKNITEQVKFHLLGALEDDDYLVREWAVYAVRKNLFENDFILLKDRLDREENVRVKEWIVKSIPYTMHNDSYNTLACELTNNFFMTDELYAEAIINSLCNYYDIHDAENTMYDIIRNERRDIVILAAIKNIVNIPNAKFDRNKVGILVNSFKKTSYVPIKQQILFYLYNLFSNNEKQKIKNLIGFYGNSNKSDLINLFITNHALLNKNLSTGIKARDYDLLMQAFEEVHSNSKSTFFYIEKLEVKMRDQYRISQAGIVGPGAGKCAKINQNYNDKVNEDDFDVISKELIALKEHIHRGVKFEDDEKYILLGEVAQIGVAIKEKDSSKFLEKLQNIGHKIYDICKEIGCSVTAEYITRTLGL